MATEQLRARSLKPGQIIQAEVFKLRSQGFNRLAHRIGGLVAENVEAFAGMDSHKALKRLQIESGVACDEVGISVPGFGMCIQKLPRSFGFESMDEAEYRESVKGICRYVASRYWPSVSPEQVEEMAESWVDE
ncbi:hypothetical protein [Uliginosibacterium sp. 31-12]|uniref:hypothetical protein n=1 Tax=Uliginosibacterium sp. 31-12 TaxID=3062781 RepID=UPI0026E3EB09|nr:hypothetical protein [Uliginosibacterium sp. 31-12]MDO6385595.1 hypothetical protein [Uliginosibacterium sp. 31-12]